jgi:hypothetical protein
MPRGSYLHLDTHDGTPVAVEEFSCAAGPSGWRYTSVVRDPSTGAEVGRVDVTLDGGGRQVRVELLAGGWRVRAGVAGRETLWLRTPAAGVAGAAGRGEADAAGGVDAAGGAGAGDAGGGAGIGGEHGVAAGARGGADGSTAGGAETGGASGALGTGSVAGDGGGGAGGGERAAVALGVTGRSPAFLVATARRLRLSPGGRARVRLVMITEPALGVLEVDESWSLAGVTTHPTDTDPLPVARYDVTDLGTGTTRTLHLAGDVVVAAPGLELTALHSPPTLDPAPPGP